MKRITNVLALFAAACGSVNERAECARHVDCPQGQYCAQTPDGSVCWADALAPAITSVTAACDGPCRRDSVLHVTARISDATSDVLDASVALDLPGDPVPMARSGADWVADVDLRRFAFEHFERDVVATVTARDGARNASAPATSGAVGVTRLLWTYDAGAPVTAPAVMADGTLVVGVSATSDQLLAVRPDGTKAWSRTVGGTSFVTAAPAIGDHAIWVGSEDFSLYAVELDGSAVKAGVGVNVGGPIKGSVAVLPDGAKEWGLAASAGGRIGAVSTATPPETGRSTSTNGYTVGPAVRGDGKVCATSANATATATLRCFTFDGGFNEDWSIDVGLNVSAPLAIDASDGVWSGSQDARLNRTSTAGASETIATLAGSVTDSPVILSNGDVVVGDQSGTLTRVTPGKVVVWSRKLNGDPLVDEPLLSPLVLGNGTAAYVLPTTTGTIYALDSSGNELWHYALAAGTELRAPNIHTPPGQPATTTMSTAYFTSSNGRIFAVLVDGQLDASAPWPKAFHDPRNTNRAGPQP